MGHILMIILHLLALAFLLPALFLTIPFHILIAAVKSRR